MATSPNKLNAAQLANMSKRLAAAAAEIKGVSPDTPGYAEKMKLLSEELALIAAKLKGQQSH